MQPSRAGEEEGKQTNGEKKSGEKSGGTGGNASDNPPKKEKDSGTNGATDSENQKEVKFTGSKEEGETQDDEKKSGEAGGNSNSSAAATSEAQIDLELVVHTLLTGTLSCSEQGGRRHAIRGNWQYSNGTEAPPLRFELVRNLTSDESLTDLPKDGEFHGSLEQCVYTTKNGKMKTKNRVVAENGVNIKFTKKEGESDVFHMEGLGFNNQLGVFELSGLATKSAVEDDPTYNVKLKKKYSHSDPPAPSPSTPGKSTAKKSKDKKRKSGVALSATPEVGLLPPPTPLHPSGVLCLRGKKLKRITSGTLGLSDNVKPKKPEPEPEPEPVEDTRPLSFEEKEALTESINCFPERFLPGVMQIIRESDLVNDDDEEIDLELDQLDTKTLWKIKRFVSENVKPKKPKPELEPVEDTRPLSFEEKEALTESINCLPERFLPGVMQIIRESDLVNVDDEEIDLELHQLDTETLWKLERFVSEKKEALALTESINCLPERFLPGVMQIIRESDLVNDDDEENDLELDQLDTEMLWKLKRFVSECQA